MTSRETGSVSKGFIITTVLIVGIALSLIFYMRSDLYLPDDIRKTTALIESGDTDALVAHLTRDIEKRRKANIADLEPMAKKGDVAAQTKLSRLYMVRGNKAQAFEWATKAADSGSLGAKSHLAYFYECGIGTERNVQEAIRLYTPAAENGDVMSQYALSGLETDKKKREHWHTQVSKAMKDCKSCDLPPGGCM